MAKIRGSSSNGQACMDNHGDRWFRVDRDQPRIGHYLRSDDPCPRFPDVSHGCWFLTWFQQRPVSRRETNADETRRTLAVTEKQRLTLYPSPRCRVQTVNQRKQKIISFASVGILTFSVAAFIGSHPLRAQTPSATTATVESAVIPVKGMSCMACVAKTKEALRAVPGVIEVEVKLSPGSATVKYDSAQVTPEKLASVIKELGYDAGTPAPKTGQ